MALKLRKLAQNQQKLFFRLFSKTHSEAGHPEISVERGMPVLTIPLPSRREKCQFTLRPIGATVGDLLDDISKEDGGIDRAAVFTTNDVRVSKSTKLGDLLMNDFKLVINSDSFTIPATRHGAFDSEHSTELDNTKSLIYTLYTSLNAEEHALEKEKRLITDLEQLRLEIAPLEKLKEELIKSAERRSAVVMWVGGAWMAFQFGLFARLTWWEYSWDIMEPVTYFAGYFTAMVAYGYYLITRQEYILPDVKNRSFLISFYKGSKKKQFDVTKYNDLRDQIAQIELDLKRLRDPLALHLPILPPKTPDEVGPRE
ncbi:calcium uniporter protein, mitochondrial-like [Symsagittifera roscoffensis]|uniref:calcium uniporter protein, mitochondrial-like n=1 Tax=Symsagittifera roscoffensis TaxID=84072 RepID=UPI00307B5CAC